MALDEAQVKKLIRSEIARLTKIVESESIEVLVGDHPLQPSVRIAPGGGLTIGTGGLAVTGGVGGVSGDIVLIGQTDPYVI